LVFLCQAKPIIALAKRLPITHEEKMRYLLELRKLVGHQPLIMVGATMLLINQQKELLMMMKIT
jgi:hypothetical protein